MTDQAKQTEAGAAFDAAEFLKGSIDESKANLGERTMAELDALQAAENAGDKRAGMLAAIDGERQARIEGHKTAFDLARQSAERAGVKIYDEADHAALQAKLDKAETKLKGVQPPKRKKAPAPRKLDGVDDKADFDGATTVAFTDGSGFTAADLPDLEFGEGDFIARSGGKVLLQEIHIPGDGPQGSVAAILLLDGKGKVAGTSKLAIPVVVGGGREAKLPARSLMFVNDAPAAAA